MNTLIRIASMVLLQTLKVFVVLPIFLPCAVNAGTVDPTYEDPWWNLEFSLIQNNKKGTSKNLEFDFNSSSSTAVDDAATIHFYDKDQFDAPYNGPESQSAEDVGAWIPLLDLAFTPDSELELVVQGEFGNCGPSGSCETWDNGSLTSTTIDYTTTIGPTDDPLDFIAIHFGGGGLLFEFHESVTEFDFKLSRVVENDDGSPGSEYDYISNFRGYAGGSGYGCPPDSDVCVTSVVPEINANTFGLACALLLGLVGLYREREGRQSLIA